MAWAAGFVAGEGSFGYHAPKGQAAMLQLTVCQVRREPLDRLAGVAGSGVVNGPYARTSPKHSPIHQWRLYGETACAFAERLRPYLSAPKREQIERVQARLLQEV